MFGSRRRERRELVAAKQREQIDRLDQILIAFRDRPPVRMVLDGQAIVSAIRHRRDDGDA